jgi:HNH endonuclease
LDILRHCASIPVITIEDIASIIDDPSNGMTLEANAHKVFDHFAWSLKMVDNASSSSQVCFVLHPISQTPNTYNIVVHRPRGLGLGIGTKRRHHITFQNFTARYTEEPLHLAKSNEILDPVMLETRYSNENKVFLCLILSLFVSILLLLEFCT